MSSLRILKHYYHLRKSQWLKTSEIEKIQQKKLRALVRHAYENVKFYHKKFDDLGIKPSDIRTVKDLKKLPIISRNDLQRNFPYGLVSKNVSIDKCKKYTSSGSTGVPVTILCNPRCEEQRGALFIRPFLECGMGLRDKMFRIGDQESRSKSWFEYFGLFRRTCISPATPLTKGVRFLEQYQPNVLYGHSSYIFLLAKQICEMDIKTISPKIIIGTAELLNKKMKNFIESSFGLKMLDFYGCVETERLAWECEERMGYHMDIDAQVIEFINNGDVVVPDEQGKIIVTCLYNYTMPLIRYDVGDVGVATNEKCSCGRGLPLLKNIEGRVNDFLKIPDGNLVSPMAIFSIMDYFPEILQFRVIQEKKDKVVVEMIMKNGFSEETIIQVQEKVATLFNNKVYVEPVVVDYISRSLGKKIHIVSSICGK